MTDTARTIRLARRPGRSISPEDFEITTAQLSELKDGEVQVRNSWMSVDPYMRLSLSTQEGLHASLPIGAEMSGAAVGVVERSRAPGLKEGALVISQKGWRDRFVAPAGEVTAVPPVASASWYVGILGLIGMTAYTGVEFVLQPEAGQTVFVSGAAGAVGSVACQLAKRRGAKVLGTAGSDAKVAWLKAEVGVDAAANYRTTDTEAFLKAEAPQGLDHYFDNVGGPTLDAALHAMRVQGKIAVCGSIALYNTDNYRVGPSDFFTMVEKSITMIGFNAGTYRERSGEVMAELSGLLASGELVWRETVAEGLDQAPAAFASLFQGDNTGKMVVRLD